MLTGSGISKESGLDTFRDADGIWARVRIEDVATPEAFARDPERVHAFYNMRRRGLLDLAVAPNAAHRALARLERDLDGPAVDLRETVAEARFLEHEAVAGEGVGGDEVGARADIILVDLPQQVGVRHGGHGTPAVAVHGRAAMLELGARGAVEDDHLTRRELRLEPVKTTCRH